MRTITTSLTPLAHCLTTFATAATRRFSAWILAAAVLAAVPGVSDTGSLRAQGLPKGFCLDCDWDRILGRWDVHWTTGLALLHGDGWGDGEHVELRSGNCDVVHGICVVILTDARKLTKEISDAVATNDIATVVEFATMPEVNLFAERSAIQVLGCDGETIAGHVPIPLTLLAEIEAATAQIPGSDT